MTEQCEMCQNKFQHTSIREYEYWTVQLFTNQYYLGRCLIKLNRHGLDLTELEKKEREELFDEVIPELKKGTDELFMPDLYNYSSLGNDCRHLHIHFIPRYSSDRVFGGSRFVDDNWNSHYIPYPEDFEIPEELFEKIRKSLKEEIR